MKNFIFVIILIKANIDNNIYISNINKKVVIKMENRINENKKKFAKEWFGKARKYFGKKIVNEITKNDNFTVSMLACMCQLHEHGQEGNLDIYKI